MAEYVVATDRGSFLITVDGGGSEFHVTLDGRTFPVTLVRWLGSTHYTLTRDDSVLPVVIRTDSEERIVGIADEQYRIRVSRRVPVARKNEQATGATSREIKAPMPGLVVSVGVTAGDAVEAGQALAIVEAMKMQSEIRAPVAGRIAAVRARSGQEVMGGAVLVVIEPFA